MPINFPTPKRCLLVQAAHWFIDGNEPLPDEIYLRAQVELKAEESKLRELFFALLAEDYDVRGDLVASFSTYEPGWLGVEIKKIGSSGYVLIKRNAIVLMGNYNLKEISFEANLIKTNADLLDPIARKKYDKRYSEFSEYVPVHPDRFFFRDVTVDFSKLRASLSGANESQASPAERRVLQTVNQQRLCERWLVGLMQNKQPAMRKDAYFAMAGKDFAISRHGFNRAWANAVKESGNLNWSKPGRKS